MPGEPAQIGATASITAPRGVHTPHTRARMRGWCARLGSAQTVELPPASVSHTPQVMLQCVVACVLCTGGVLSVAKNIQPVKFSDIIEDSR